MKKSLKAALLSAFVLPGSGHFFLKKYTMGSILAIAAFSGLYSIIVTTIDKALKIAEKIQTSSPPLSIEEISALISQQILHSEAQQINAALLVLLVAWVIGIIDAYRLGAIQEKHED
ncbi:MAG: hypothetical protein ACJAWS_002754 [Oleiphilaceae bacterium]|jgi:hypothetical protein